MKHRNITTKILCALILFIGCALFSNAYTVMAGWGAISEDTGKDDYIETHTGQQAQQGQVLDLSGLRTYNKIYDYSKWTVTTTITYNNGTPTRVDVQTNQSHIDTTVRARSLWNSYKTNTTVESIEVKCELASVLIEQFRDTGLTNANGKKLYDPKDIINSWRVPGDGDAIDIWDNKIPNDHVSSSGSTWFSTDSTKLTRKQAEKEGIIPELGPSPTPEPTRKPGQTATPTPRVTNPPRPTNTPRPTPIPMHYIYYDGNGATSGEMSSDSGYNFITIKQNQYLRDGYHFAGYWTSSPTGGIHYTPGKTIILDNDITVYAQWIENNCILTFDYCTSYLGDAAERLSLGTYGSSLTGGQKVRVYDETDPTGQNYTNVTLRANQKTFTASSILGSLPTPTCEGYVFRGWSIMTYGNVDTQNGNPYSLVDSNTAMESFATNYVTLYASWLPLEVNVHFNLNITDKSEINLNEVQDIQVYYMQKYPELPEIHKTGYEIPQWEDELGNIVTEGSTVLINHDHMLKAIWKPQKYTLSFETNGGTACSPMDVYYYDPSDVYTHATYPELPTPEKEGYIFDGWYLDANCKEKLVSQGTQVTVAGNHKLYAKWKALTFELTFVYNWTWKRDAVDARINGGSVNINNLATSTQTVSYNAAYGRLPAPAREGYDFLHWKTADGQIVTTATYHKTLGNLTLYAEWKPKTYLIILDDNTTTYYTYDDPAYGN